MKKLLALMLVLVLGLCSTACANDMKAKLDGLSQEELTELDKQALQRIRRLDAFELEKSGTPVELLPGLYKIGEDIPAGTWALNAFESSFMYVIATELNDEGFLANDAVTALGFLPEDNGEMKKVLEFPQDGYLRIEGRTALLTKPE